MTIGVGAKFTKSQNNGLNTWYSQPVTHASTNHARRCLTSQIGRDGVYSTWYGPSHSSYCLKPDIYSLHQLWYVTNAFRDVSNNVFHGRRDGVVEGGVLLLNVWYWFWQQVPYKQNSSYTSLTRVWTRVKLVWSLCNSSLTQVLSFKFLSGNHF